MAQNPENFFYKNGGFSQAGFESNQADFQRQVRHDLSARDKYKKEKGGTYYIIFPNIKIRDEVIKFINSIYGQKFPVTAEPDPQRSEGIKINFNNAAEEQKNLLLHILAQPDHGWHATGEEHFVEQTYEPAPLTEPILPVVEKRPKPATVKIIRPKLQPKPAGHDQETWEGREAA